MVLFPLSSMAAEFTITQTSNEIIGNSFIGHYSVPQPPATVKKIHLWVGEYSKIATTWITQNDIVINLGVSNVGYPKVFNAEIDLSRLTPGIKYAYAITDRNTGTLDAATAYDPNMTDSLEVRCFTTAGSVPCKEPTVPPTNSSESIFNTTSFNLEVLEQGIDTENAGKFLQLISITPKQTLYDPVTVVLEIYKELANSQELLKSGTLNLSAGTATTYPTVVNLDPGNYSAQLFVGSTKVSGNASFSITTGSGPTPGGAKAVFIYTNLPKISCDEEVKLCDFNVPINVTTPGTLKFGVHAYSKTIYDGKPKVSGPEITGDKGYPEFTVGNKNIVFSMTYDQVSAFTHSVDDKAFWINFHETQNDKASGLSLLFDTATAGIPFAPNADPESAASLDFKGTAAAADDVTGACGSVDDTTTTVITESSANLCAKGFVRVFKFDGTSWTWNCTGTSGVPASCNATASTDTNYGSSFLKNPLAAGLDTFPKIFAAVYNNIILPIAIPFIVLAIMYAGFKFIIARKSGSTTTYTDAKRILKYTLIGTALLLGGWVIANALQGTLNSLLGPDSAKPAAVLDVDTSIV